MKTQEQTRQDIAEYATRQIEGTPNNWLDSGLRGTIETVRKNIQNSVKRGERSPIQATEDTETAVGDLTEYISFLENVRDLAKSGDFDSIQNLIDDYDRKGKSHRTEALKFLQPGVLEERLREEYLNPLIEQVPIFPSHRQTSLNYLSCECGRHPEIAQDELTEQVFQRVKDLYQYVHKNSAKTGCRQIVAVYPSCGSYETADQAVSSALDRVAKAKGMNPDEIKSLMNELRGDVDLSKARYGDIGLRVV